ncbi:hypothetical protein OSB04_021266 [Centaurea solstitialis]|uniref:Enoyl reductase (ER) domain-containing protein n=1 Tax=Centaurea solstitialis TaxID=347529 RepID=A0AA38TDK1_9ASTR|nr:hypothetical protein OSB04_021266 [Centaurea solstitialis]
MEVMKNKFLTITTNIEGQPQESMFEIKTQTLPPLENNDVLIKCLYISIDPYHLPDKPHEAPEFITNFCGSCIQNHPWNVELIDEVKLYICQAINGSGVGRVIASENDGYEKDDIVCGLLNWAEYTIVKNENTLRKLNTMEEFPLSYHLGIFGTSGLTAYGGFFHVCKPKKGEKVFVSAAAGSVGNLVGQYAKLLGCYVIGCAGTKQKVEMLKEKLGFDDAFNYKEKTDLNSTLRRYFPDGIDIYFDNVGGEMLEAAIANMNPFGRVAVCGVISHYTNSQKQVTPNMIDVIYKRIMIQGFLVSDFYTNDFKDFMPVTTDYVRSGKLCVLEDISHGIESIPSAFRGLFQGENLGKKIVQIAQE